MAVKSSRRVLEVRRVGIEPLTVPEGVIELLGLTNGDSVAFIEVDGQIVVEGEPRRSLEDVIGSLVTDRPFVTDDEMVAELELALADKLSEEYARIFQDKE